MFFDKKIIIDVFGVLKKDIYLYMLFNYELSYKS